MKFWTGWKWLGGGVGFGLGFLYGSFIGCHGG